MKTDSMIVIEQGYVCFGNFQSLLNVLGYASHI